MCPLLSLSSQLTCPPDDWPLLPPCCRDTDAAAVAATAAAGWGVWDAYALTLPLVNLPKAQRPLWDGRHFLGALQVPCCAAGPVLVRRRRGCRSAACSTDRQ